MSEVVASRRKRAKTGGRQKGTPNRITLKVREAIAELTHDNVEQVQVWLERVAEKNPAEAIRLWIQIVEFTLPKLRASLTVNERPGKPIKQMSMSELQGVIVVADNEAL